MPANSPNDKCGKSVIPRSRIAATRNLYLRLATSLTEAEIPYA